MTNLFGLVHRLYQSHKLRLRVLSLFDQIMFSAGNFILTVVLARYYSDVQVGGYGVGLSIALMAQGILRTVYVVQNSVLSPKIFCRRSSKVLGLHLILCGGIVVAEFLFATGYLFFSTGEHAIAILCSVLVCSLIYLQLDFERIALLKHDKIVDPFLASAMFLVMNACLFFAVPYFHLSYILTMSIVGGFAFLKILHMFLLLPRPNLYWGWHLTKKALRRYLAATLVGVAGTTGFSHVPLFLLSAVAAPIQSAAFVALRGLMQPLLIIIRSLDVIDKNLFQAGTQGPQGLRAGFLRQVPLYLAFSGMAVIGTLLLGRPILLLFYGERYADHADLLIGWALVFSLITLHSPLETVVVKMGRINAYNYWRLLAGAVGIVASYALCAPFGALGAIGASAIGWIISLLSGLWVIRDVFMSQPKRS